MFALLAPLALSLSGAPSTPQWGLFQLNLTGPAESSSYNPFEKVVVSATFEHHGSRGVLEVTGFFDGGARYCVRFSPPAQGEWTYTTASNVPELSNVTGSLVVQGVQGKGPVRSRGFGLYTADGEPHVSVGTTSYQWASMHRDAKPSRWLAGQARSIRESLVRSRKLLQLETFCKDTFLAVDPIAQTAQRNARIRRDLKMYPSGTPSFTAAPGAPRRSPALLRAARAFHTRASLFRIPTPK